jgi:predicted MFS family arabinose efflux permease
MAVLLVTGVAEVWHLLVFSLASGIGWSFIWPVRMAIVPALVPKEELMNSIALSSASMNFTRIAGPALGGLLLATMGGGGNFSVQAIFYGVMVMMILTMNVPERADLGHARTSSFWHGMMEGVSYVRKNQVVLALLALGVTTLTLTMPLQSLLPVFAGEVYDIGPGGLGIMMSFAGLGAFIGTLTVASLGDIKRKGQIFLTCFAAMGVWLVIFGLTPWLPLAIVFLMILSVFQMTFMTIHQTLLQTAVSDEVRGRVFSINMMTFGIMPLGTFAAGGAAEVIGAPATMAIMGVIITVLAAFSFARLRVIREL